VPNPVFQALVHVATAMARGQGVTVMPLNALLTIQEAADLLGISRPTLVRLLEDGEIATSSAAGTVGSCCRTCLRTRR
jgi:Helix-turn-helix domain